TWIVGGKVPQLGGSSALGQGPDIVVEACEFDRSFHNYSAATAIVLNVEEDHLDCYGGGLAEIVESFVEFGVRLRDGGTLVVNAAASRAGVEPRRAAEVVGGFHGVSRRFEVLAREPITVIDDYAHHPTAVSAVVRAARARFPGRRIICCFEPHQANRTRHL